MRNYGVDNCIRLGIRHSAFGIRHSAFGIRHSAFGIRHSATTPDLDFEK
jgi:hypothetical protein